MKVGVLGMGSIGKRHIENLENMGHHVARHDPVMNTSGREEVIRWADAVLICSPSKNHARDLTDVLRAERHVFVEKPFGYDCPALLDGFLQGNRSICPNLVVATGFNLRFHKCVQRVKFWLDNGAIGSVQSAGFSVLQKTEKPPYLRDGIIRNWCSHELDLARYLLGDMTVASCEAPKDEHGNDSIEANILLRLKSSGAVVKIGADYYSDPEVRCFWIKGGEGTIYADLVARTARMEHKSGSSVSFNAKDSFDENYRDEINAFIALCGERLGWDSPLASGEDGVANLYTIMEARRAAGFDD